MTEQKLFYNCNLFNDKNFSVTEKFSVIQNELLLSQGPQTLDNMRFKFNKIEVVYECEWIKQAGWSNKKPTLLIPIRNNKKLIDYTIVNLKETNIVKHCNIIIIDDRSTEDIRKFAIDNNLSYLRIDNDKGFNFSMLNNIAAKICYDLGNETIILWNSDLWCVKEEWFLTFLKKHKQSDSWVSGSKLVYPPKEKSLNKSIDTENIKSNFSNKTELMNGRWRNTIQFGGPGWTQVQRQEGSSSFSYHFPTHHRRFAPVDDLLATSDKPVSHITGALHIWNLDKYISLGGLNPSLSRSFQDIDICLKVLEQGTAPMYFGKDIYFYHDESYNFYNNNNEKKYVHQNKNDSILFSKIWKEKLFSLVI